jgi:hypothetical protein
MSEEKREKMKAHIPEEAREHMKQAREEMRESVRALFPPEFIKHRRAARKEMLLAMRGLVNHAIEKLESKDA